MRRIVLLLSLVGAVLMMCAVPGLAQTRIPPDLTVTYQYGPTKVQPGQTSIYYHGEVANKGGSPATISAGTVIAKRTFTGATANSCYWSGPDSFRNYSCQGTGTDTMEVVASQDITLGVGQGLYFYDYVNTPTTDAKITTQVTLDPNNAIAETNENNNASDTITTYVGTPPQTDLSVTQTDSADPVDIDGYLSYNVKVTNNGEDTAFNTVVEDYLPENVTFEYAYGGRYECNHIPEYKAVVCPIGDIPSGESRTMEVMVRPTAAGTISNSATVYSDNGDPNLANDTAKEDTLVQTAPVYEPVPDEPPPPVVEPAQDTTRPTVSSISPRPNSTTRDRTPTIKATVRDGQSNLVKSNMKLYVDGKRVTTFSYSPSTDRLSYTTKRLSYASHTAKIVATDAAGNAVTKSWRFKVAR